MSVPAIGEMDQRITITGIASRINDGSGSHTVASEPVKVWAKVVDVSTRERMIMGQMNPMRLVKCTIRSRQDLNNEVKVSWKGKNFNVVSIVEVGDRLHPFQELLCEEALSP